METHTKEERELYHWKRIELELSAGKSAGTLMCANAIVMEQEQANRLTHMSLNTGGSVVVVVALVVVVMVVTVPVAAEVIIMVILVVVVKNN